MLKHMDSDDHGCRHELLRIVKTIFKRELTSSVPLQSYHLKTAFMHYIRMSPEHWNDRNSLGRHFVGFLEELQSQLERGKLPHFWLPDVNLHEDTDPAVVNQMGNRLKNILNSEAAMNRILGGGRMSQSQQTDRERYRIPWCRMRQEDVMQRGHIPLYKMPQVGNNLVLRVSPRAWERGLADDRTQIDLQRNNIPSSRMRQEAVTDSVRHSEYISLVSIPEVEDRTPMERYCIRGLGRLPQLNDIMEDEGNYIPRFVMSQNAELEGILQHRPECCLKFVSRFVLRFLLGLILFPIGVLIFASWLAGVEILIILVWLGLCHID